MENLAPIGRTEDSVQKMLCYYMGGDPARHQNAIGKLNIWLENEGAQL